MTDTEIVEAMLDAADYDLPVGYESGAGMERALAVATPEIERRYAQRLLGHIWDMGEYKSHVVLRRAIDRERGISLEDE